MVTGQRSANATAPSGERKPQVSNYSTSQIHLKQWWDNYHHSVGGPYRSVNDASIQARKLLQGDLNLLKVEIIKSSTNHAVIKVITRK